MRIVILGCGRVGARLANRLHAQGHQVAIIDKSPDAFSRLSPEFGGEAILGTGIDGEVLEQAGIEQADVFITVTEDDNINIMASQMAQLIYRVKKVITRIYDPAREKVFRELGLTTVCPTEMTAKLLRDKLVGAAPATTPAARGGR